MGVKENQMHDLIASAEKPEDPKKPVDAAELIKETEAAIAHAVALATRAGIYGLAKDLEPAAFRLIEYGLDVKDARLEQIGHDMLDLSADMLGWYHGVEGKAEWKRMSKTTQDVE